MAMLDHNRYPSHPLFEPMCILAGGPRCGIEPRAEGLVSKLVPLSGKGRMIWPVNRHPRLRIGSWLMEL